MAKGKHPATFRTRKLSPSAPMVLHGELCGRVGRRRTIFPERAARKGGPFAFTTPVLEVCAASRGQEFKNFGNGHGEGRFGTWQKDGSPQETADTGEAAAAEIEVEADALQAVGAQV